MGNDDIVTKDSPSAGEESPEATPEAVVEPTMAEQIATGVTQAMNEALPRLKQSIHDTVRTTYFGYHLPSPKTSRISSTSERRQGCLSSISFA